MYEKPSIGPMFPATEQYEMPQKAPMFPADEPNENSSLEELAAYALQKQKGIFARDKMNANDLWLMGQALSWARPKVGHGKWEEWWKDRGFKKTYVWQARKLYENAPSLEKVKKLGLTEALLKFGIIKAKKEKSSVSKPSKDVLTESVENTSVKEKDSQTPEEGKEPIDESEASESTQEPTEQNENGGEPEDNSADRFVEQEAKKPKKGQDFRTLTPHAKAVAILHALEFLRDDLNGQEVNDDLRDTFSQIAALVEQLKGPNQEVECRLAA